MYPHHQVEVVRGHVPDGSVANDPGVVDHDVETAEVAEGPVHHGGGLVLVSDVSEVGDGLTAPFVDDGNDLLRVATLALAVDRTAQVVDHDRGALRRQLQGVSTADAVSGAGHQRDLSVKQASHSSSPSDRRAGSCQSSQPS